jgi:hypothetical protein
MTNPKNRETDKQRKADKKLPAAGPHDKPDQTDKEKAPGTGILLEDDVTEVEVPTC